jgi:hypothetical protein
MTSERSLPSTHRTANRDGHTPNVISRSIVMDKQAGLSQPHHDSRGAYDIVIRSSGSIVSPGDKVLFEVYITGYGSIAHACVGIYPSWSIFRIEESKVSCGGGEYRSMDPLGVIVNISDQSFYDASGAYQISTECKPLLPSSRAPINLDIKVDPKATPGVHFIQFAFKYFTGECWSVVTSSTSISIRTFYQRHQTLVWAIAGIAAVLSILANVVPAVSYLAPMPFGNSR